MALTPRYSCFDVLAECWDYSDKLACLARFERATLTGNKKPARKRVGTNKNLFYDLGFMRYSKTKSLRWNGSAR
jgi:hypothetical protein